MSATAVLAPVFVETTLTFGLLVWLGFARIAALRARKARLRDVALGEPKWPAAVTQIQNAYQNQFELPVLFYALIALALATGHATAALVVLSWLFVATRLVHAFIHTTSNNVPQRFWVYTAGMVVLILMWAIFAFEIVAG